MNDNKGLNDAEQKSGAEIFLSTVFISRPLLFWSWVVKKKMDYEFLK